MRIRRWTASGRAERVHDEDDRTPVPPAVRRPLFLAVSALEDANRALDQRVRTVFGVNNMDYAVLQFLDRVARRGGSARVGDIATRFGVSSGSATEIVHRLTAAGLVERAVGATDARVRELHLTEAALLRMHEVIGDLRGELDLLLDSISPAEEERLLQLLAAVHEIVERPRR